MSANSLIACHECDLLHRVQPLPDGSAARCVRCGAVLYRQKKDSLERTLALTIAGIILFIVANTYPFLAMKSEGLVQETTLITGVKELHAQGMEALALLVLLTTILVPFAHLASIHVVVGQLVNPETVIGTVGDTGCATGPHLHFGLRHDGMLVDPVKAVKE